ncbi:MAG: ergothioneine biosynthesis glutamate--cysteine ligase EgtA [Actinocatenispora sp.]
MSGALRSDEDVNGYIGRVCFKTGPPQRVGVELEWIVADVTRPARRVPVELLRAALADPLPGGSALTFEPGGQLELSSPPGAGLAACLAPMVRDLAHVEAALCPLGLVLVPSAVDPYRPPERQVRTDRYDAMESYFDARGHLGRIMMCSTAAVQVNLDAGADPADIARRWRLLHAVGPTMVAAFANSPVRAGRVTGWKSTRQAVWQRLDPPRTGPPVTGDPVATWAGYALDAPVLAVPDRPFRADPGFTFREWLGGADRPPTGEDLAFHLTTLFPPVRPRGWLEVRYLDALPAQWWPVPVAVLTALTADPESCAAAVAATAPVRTSWLAAARYGLAHPDLALAALGCFDAALDALLRSGDDTDLVASYLDRYVSRGRCPADDVIDAELNAAGEPV